MRKLFTILACAAAMVACENDEIVRQDLGDRIEFGSFVENSTRAAAAADPSYSTTGQGVALTAFKVYGTVGGVNIFDGDNVTKTADYGAAWTCKDDQTNEVVKQYWIAGAEYVFDAVVDATSVVTNDETGLPETLKYVVANQTDMLYKRVTTTGLAENNPVVAFQFTHLLSKVKFSVTNTTAAAATNYRINVKAVKLLNVYPSGDYTIAFDADGNNVSTWTPATASEFALETYAVESNSTQFNSKEVLLIPGSAIGVYVLADIEATDDGGTNWTKVSDVEKTFNNVLGAGNALQANTAYHFAVSLGLSNEIQFTATQMPEWTDGDDADDTPLNM